MQFNPNLDPHIKPFEIVLENDEEVVVRTGFEALIRKKLAYPMPDFLSFETDTVEKMEAFEFDDPWDERRYFRGGDDQINGVGDGFVRNLAPFVDRLKPAWPDFADLWRSLRGARNALAHHRFGKRHALDRPVP